MPVSDKDIFIKRSHDRSKSFGIDPERQFPKHIIEGLEFQHQLEENKELLDIADPIISQLLAIVEKNGFVIVLTDSDASILKIVGGKETLKAAGDLNMVEGASMSEKSIGTNAMGRELVKMLRFKLPQKSISFRPITNGLVQLLQFIITTILLVH